MGAPKLSAAMFQILLSVSDQPRHGLGVVEDIENRTDGRVKLGPALLYTSIRKLREAGWIEELDSEDDPRRKYLRVTASGRRVLKREAELLDSIVATARARRVLG